MSDLVVLVPVLNRPHRVRPLIESFNASGAPGYLRFIVHHRDRAEWQALMDADACFTIGEASSWPEKINLGYRGRVEPWLLLAADDIHFHPGWWEATELLRDAGYGVIGTNDLGNPAVLRGTHTTHALVSRRYIDEKGGTVDGPGTVIHEGYRHWFCDNELVETAKARGQWAFCRESIVEHLHPYYGKAPHDATYALGEKHRHEDAALWAQRRLRIAA